MKIIPGPSRHHCLARIGIFLFTLALITGMAGCDGDLDLEYQLTITSTVGGHVTEPGEGTFTYHRGAVVNLVAQAEVDYGFHYWTGPLTIADITAAVTTIIMNGDYSITANFGEITEIWDWSDLDTIRDNPSGFYLLMTDLDSTTANYTGLASPTANEGKGWRPIGSHTINDEFVGGFDGQGYEIRDLFINRPDEDFVGLFGCIDGGVIRDIGVVNASVIGNQYVSGLVGENWGIVSHCHFTGSVTGIRAVGGLVGYNYGLASNSYSTGSVTSTEGSVGGLVGSNEGNLRTSYSTGSVTGNSAVGGLVGGRWGTTVSNCFWDRDTSGQTTSAGGRGRTTNEMKDFSTFSGAGWNIIAVALNETNPVYIWNIVNNVTYPFLGWQP